jgi:hypothetical protein
MMDLRRTPAGAIRLPNTVVTVDSVVSVVSVVFGGDGVTGALERRAEGSRSACVVPQPACRAASLRRK